MRKQNGVLWGMVAISIAAHFLVWLWLQYQKQIPAGKHGVVSVNFIEKVDHGVAHTPRAKAKALSANPDKINPQPDSSAPQNEASSEVDPAAVTGASQVFIAAVMDLIAKKRIYPREAIEREQEGKVVVGVTLDRDGRVTAASVEKPSPFQLLNDAALKTVYAVGQFPRVPDIMSAPVHLDVPLVYRIERN